MMVLAVVNLTFFEDTQQSYAHIIKANNLILAKGVVRRTGARGVSIRASAAWPLEQLYEKWVSDQIFNRQGSFIIQSVP